jgi:hypothetical protein
LTGSCLLAGALAESMRAFFGVLERRTVADLVAEPATRRVMQAVKTVE